MKKYSLIFLLIITFITNISLAAGVFARIPRGMTDNSPCKRTTFKIISFGSSEDGEKPVMPPLGVTYGAFNNMKDTSYSIPNGQWFIIRLTSEEDPVGKDLVKERKFNDSDTYEIIQNRGCTTFTFNKL